jgi:hypothetical protein
MRITHRTHGGIRESAFDAGATCQTRPDIAIVTRLRLTLYTTLDRSDRGVEVFLEYLRGVGTDWPLRPTRDEVLQEYDRIWSLVGRRHIEELVDLPIHKS